MSICSSVSLLLIFLTLLVSSTTKQINVNLSLGPVTGQFIQPSLMLFQGIRYAQPPLASLRFQPPQPITSWTQFLPNTKSCLQSKDMISSTHTLQSSEDCLHLNIYTTDTQAKKPVLVYLHGGGFILGSAESKEVTPNFIEFIKRSQAVVVTLNYRLGPLGFLAHSADENIHGNAGFLDQQLALNFVKEHIQQFGGDPEQVTLFGNSAGAISICLHLMESSELFHRAILSSPLCEFPFPTLEEGYKMTEELANVVGCPSTGKDSIDCLQKVDGETLSRALKLKRGITFYDGHNWFPAIDGKFIRNHPIDYLAENHLTDIDAIMFGSTKDEGTLFLLLAFPMYLDKDQIPAMLEKSYGAEFQEQILAHYHREGEPMKVTASRMMSDAWICSVMRFAKLVDSKSPETNVFYYLLHHPWEGTMNRFEFLGAHHGSDLKMFNPHNERLTDEEIELSSAFLNSLVSFVTAESTEKLPLFSGQHWGEFDDESDIVVLRPGISTWDEELALKYQESCPLWESILVDEKVVLFGSEVEEPLLSVLLNVYLLKALIFLRKNPYFAIGLTCGSILFFIASCCFCRRPKPHQD